MKIGEIVRYKGEKGEVIGETTSLLYGAKKVYFVRLCSGKIVEPYQEEINLEKLPLCGECEHYCDLKRYARCGFSTKRIVHEFDIACYKFNPK